MSSQKLPMLNLSSFVCLIAHSLSLLMKIARLLKHLATMGVIAEAGEDTYRRNGFSTSLAMKRYSDAYPCMYVVPRPDQAQVIRPSPG